MGLLRLNSLCFSIICLIVKILSVLDLPLLKPHSVSLAKVPSLSYLSFHYLTIKLVCHIKQTYTMIIIIFIHVTFIEYRFQYYFPIFQNSQLHPAFIQQIQKSQLKQDPSVFQKFCIQSIRSCSFTIFDLLQCSSEYSSGS